MFTPAAINRWLPRVQTLVEELLTDEEFLDARSSGAPIDILGALADPLPTLVIAEMMGVPSTDRAMFKEWSHALVNAAFAGESGDLKTDELIAAGKAASDAMDRYFSEHIVAKTENPGDDLISMMILANSDGTMSPGELLVSSKLFITAGNETTTKLIANGILALARNGDQRRRLAGDPALLTSAVEEVFRYDGPVQFLPRGAGNGRASVTPRSPAGARSGCSRAPHTATSRCTRTQRRSTSPSRPNPQLGLGHGVHLCLGAHLLRLEGRLALGPPTAHIPDFDVSEVDYAPALAVRGPCRLKIAELARVRRATT